MNQQGNSALGMVLMILLMGRLTLHASREKLEPGMSLVADERQHINEFCTAQSAAGLPAGSAAGLGKLFTEGE